MYIDMQNPREYIAEISKFSVQHYIQIYVHIKASQHPAYYNKSFTHYLMETNQQQY